MAIQRVFYVTQGSLSVWAPGAAGPERIAVFADDDEGLHEFDLYIAHVPEQDSILLLDVIEEEFSSETMPRLGLRDRNALMARRRLRKYRRTPYSLSFYQGKADDGDECRVLHSAVSNRELLDLWLQVILRHRVPLAGVCSVPLMAPALFARLFQPETPALFVAAHQGNKLRQVFIRDGRLQSARLSQAPGTDAKAFAEFVVNEARRSRRYLERIRLLNAMETLEVCVVADDDVARRMRDLAEGEFSFHFSFVDSATAAGRLPGCISIAADHFESAYLKGLFRHRPKHSYASSGENRYWVMRRIRQSVIGLSTAIAAACSIAAGFYLSDAWLLKSRVQQIRSQVAQLTETYRREHEKFNPIQAGSHEMKLAVDTGQYILRNRLPVPWVMNQVGVVLGDYPDVQVRELQWIAESPATQAPPPRRRDVPVPVAIPEVLEVGAVITADIAPFDGDMRKAFARIDALASDLKSRTRFTRAITVEYPLNASTSVAVSGEIGVESDFARFRIRVSYDVPGTPGTEVPDEPI